ncbi:hypothetical protein, partial [Chromobacterium piscinae]|uniref:hypothetical protein n=1 Tax=Chromobacterium piscinae TaxID=686831 RepID=UPI00320ACD77
MEKADFGPLFCFLPPRAPGLAGWYGAGRKPERVIERNHGERGRRAWEAAMDWKTWFCGGAVALAAAE